MVPCIFQLSELEELGLIFQEENKQEFVCRFVRYMKTLLRVKAAESDTVNASFWANGDPTGITSCYVTAVSPDNLRRDWALLREMILFVPSYGMQKLVVARLAFLKRCRERMNKLSERGFWYFLRHYPRYQLVRHYFNDADLEVNFQDIFSSAVAYFMRKGWGKPGEFKLMMGEF